MPTKRVPLDIIEIRRITWMRRLAAGNPGILAQAVLPPRDSSPDAPLPGLPGKSF